MNQRLRFIFKILMVFSFFILSFCSGNYRTVKSSSILKENEGILIIKLKHNIAPMIEELKIYIKGYDINKAEVPEISSFTISLKYPLVYTFSYIVPAGRYRIEEIIAYTTDPGVNQARSAKTKLEYKPRFSFYVIKGKINLLGEIYIQRIGLKKGIGVMRMHSSDAGESVYYKLNQDISYSIANKFIKEYPKIKKQISGVKPQHIIFKPWNRVYGHSDPLKRSPQFENGYFNISWKSTFDIAKNYLDNKHRLPKLEVVNKYKLIDETKKEEVAIYEFNTVKKIKYPVGGLYKVTIIRVGKYKDVLAKMKNLYGVYNTEGNKTVWRLINSRVTLEPHGNNMVRITKVSMEYIRKVAQLKPSAAGTFNPAETNMRPSGAPPETQETQESGNTNNSSENDSSGTSE